jgi:beta-RFAP synthase
LDALFNIPRMSASELAQSVGRGQRSAVGTYGFGHGGLIAELGKWKDQPLAQLERRIALPGTWRFVLLIPTDQVGLSGSAEQRAFDAMMPVPRQVTQQLLSELWDNLLPSAEQGDFDEFGESVYRYGITAGRCFAQRQAGAFASSQLAQWVKMIRAMGVRGVGQSSWGPTLFALLAGENEATDFVRQLRQRLETQCVQLVITSTTAAGASCTKQLID